MMDKAIFNIKRSISSTTPRSYRKKSPSSLTSTHSTPIPNASHTRSDTITNLNGYIELSLENNILSLKSDPEIAKVIEYARQRGRDNYDQRNPHERTLSSQRAPFEFINWTYMSPKEQKSYDLQLTKDSNALRNPFQLERWCRNFDIRFVDAEPLTFLNRGSGSHPKENYLQLRKRQNRDYAQEFMETGINYALDEQYDYALNLYKKAIEMDPEFVDVWVARGAAYANLGDHDKAIADFEHALKLNPNHKNANDYLGKTLKAKADQSNTQASRSYPRMFVPPPPANPKYLEPQRPPPPPPPTNQTPSKPQEKQPQIRQPLPPQDILIPTSTTTTTASSSSSLLLLHSHKHPSHSQTHLHSQSHSQSHSQPHSQSHSQSHPHQSHTHQSHTHQSHSHQTHSQPHSQLHSQLHSSKLSKNPNLIPLPPRHSTSISDHSHREQEHLEDNSEAVPKKRKSDESIQDEEGSEPKKKRVDREINEMTRSFGAEKEDGALDDEWPVVENGRNLDNHRDSELRTEENIKRRGRRSSVVKEDSKRERVSEPEKEWDYMKEKDRDSSHSHRRRDSPAHSKSRERALGKIRDEQRSMTRDSYRSSNRSSTRESEQISENGVREHSRERTIDKDKDTEKSHRPASHSTISSQKHSSSDVPRDRDRHHTFPRRRQGSRKMDTYFGSGHGGDTYFGPGYDDQKDSGRRSLKDDVYIPRYNDESGRSRRNSDVYIAKHDDGRSRSREGMRERSESYSYRDYRIRLSSRERERTRSPPPPPASSSSSNRRNDPHGDEPDSQRREKKSRERALSRGKGKAGDNDILDLRRPDSDGASIDERVSSPPSKKAPYTLKSWAPARRDRISDKEHSEDILPTPENTQRLSESMSPTPDRAKREREREKEEKIIEEEKKDKERVVKMRKA